MWSYKKELQPFLFLQSNKFRLVNGKYWLELESICNWNTPPVKNLQVFWPIILNIEETLVFLLFHCSHLQWSWFATYFLQVFERSILTRNRTRKHKQPPNPQNHYPIANEDYLIRTKKKRRKEKNMLFDEYFCYRWNNQLRLTTGYN